MSLLIYILYKIFERIPSSLDLTRHYKVLHLSSNPALYLSDIGMLHNLYLYENADSSKPVEEANIQYFKPATLRETTSPA